MFQGRDGALTPEQMQQAKAGEKGWDKVSQESLDVALMVVGLNLPGFSGISQKFQ